MFKSIKAVCSVCKWEFYRWLTSARIIMLFCILAAFLLFHLHGVSALAGMLDVNVSPWVFPHLLSPTVLVFVTCITALLFSSLPLCGDDLYFIAARIGRTCWMAAQMLYIAAAALFYTIFICLVSIAALIPRVSFMNDWGPLLRTMAEDPSFVINRGVDSTLYVYSQIVSEFHPLEAMGISLLLLWFGSMLIGVLILFFNLAFRKPIGVVISFALSVLAYFSYYAGQFTVGPWLANFSPYNWSSMIYLDFHNRISDSISASWAILITWILIFAMSAGSFLLARHKDLDVLGE